MLDYKNLLILSYFYQNNSNYSLEKLQNLLGSTLDQLEQRLYQLIGDKYLEYEDNLLCITEKGLSIVLKNNMGAFPFELSDVTPIRNKRDRLDLEDVYIPYNFLVKIHT